MSSAKPGQKEERKKEFNKGKWRKKYFFSRKTKKKGESPGKG